MDERTYLRVKIKSLAAEAKIIRQETKRAKSWSIKHGLWAHRVGIVRFEARHTQLAYGFLRGRAYREMEPTAKEAPDWNKIRKMVEKYGSHWDVSCEDYMNPNNPTSLTGSKKHLVETLKRFDEWMIEAKKNSVQGTA